MVAFKKILKFSFFLLLLSCSMEKLTSYEGSEDHFKRCEYFFNDEKYLRAKEDFKMWKYNAGLSSNLSKAQFYIAECEYNLEDYNQALIEYDRYLNMADQSSTLAKKAELMICRCHFKLTHDYKKDQTETKRALENLQYYIEKKSMKEHIEEIQNMITELRNKLATKEFETARFYIRIKEYEAAKIYFENILKEFYDTKYFGISLFNLSLLKHYDDKDRAIKLLEEYKNNFHNLDEFNSLIADLEKMNFNEGFKYYLDKLK